MEGTEPFSAGVQERHANPYICAVVGAGVITVWRARAFICFCLQVQCSFMESGHCLNVWSFLCNPGRMDDPGQHIHG